jgi:hypothetical protein
MMELRHLAMVNWHLFDVADIPVAGHIGVLGENRSGKTPRGAARDRIGAVRAPAPCRWAHRSRRRGPVGCLSALCRTFAEGSGPHPLPRTAGLHAHDRKLRELQQAYNRGGPGSPRDNDLCRRLPLARDAGGAADPRRRSVSGHPDLPLVGHRSGRDLDSAGSSSSCSSVLAPSAAR